MFPKCWHWHKGKGLSPGFFWRICPQCIEGPQKFNIFTLKHDLRTFVEKCCKSHFHTIMGQIRQGARVCVGGGRTNYGNAKISGTFGQLVTQSLPYPNPHLTLKQKTLPNQSLQRLYKLKLPKWKSPEGWSKGPDSVTVSQPPPRRCIKIWSINAPTIHCTKSLLLACQLLW